MSVRPESCCSAVRAASRSCHGSVSVRPVVRGRGTYSEYGRQHHDTFVAGTNAHTPPMDGTVGVSVCYSRGGRGNTAVGDVAVVFDGRTH